MALITTVGGPRSNSYVSLEEANSIAGQAHYDTAAWDALSDAAKEYCLILAAAALDRLPLRGRKVNRMYYPLYDTDGSILSEGYEEQSMAFPRTVQYDRTIIPDVVKETQVLIAASIIAPLYPPEGMDDAASPRRVRSFRIASLSVTLESDQPRPQLEFLLSDKNLLATSVIALRMKPYLAQIRLRRVDSYDDRQAAAYSDRIEVVTTTTTTTTTTTSTTTTTTTA